MKSLLLLGLCALGLCAAPPAVGEKAPDFALKNLKGEMIRLTELTAKGPVVLIVLRGFPSYQCPLCNRQVKEFTAKASEFRGKTVLLVYPGPGENLDAKATEFLMDKTLPPGFEMVLDPDYAFTKRYGLRWEAPQETAYPSTFLIDSKGMVFYVKTSRTHGGRTKPEEVLAELQK